MRKLSTAVGQYLLALEEVRSIAVGARRGRARRRSLSLLFLPGRLLPLLPLYSMCIQPLCCPAHPPNLSLSSENARLSKRQLSLLLLPLLPLHSMCVQTLCCPAHQSHLDLSQVAEAKTMQGSADRFEAHTVLCNHPGACKTSRHRY